MINKRLVGDNTGSHATMQVQGVGGDLVQAVRVLLNVSCCPDGDGKFTDVNGPTQIILTVTDCMTRCDAILPSTICDELRTAKPCLVMLIRTVQVLANRQCLILMNHKPTNS